MEQPRTLISIVDHHASIREALPDLLKTLGLDAESFDSAEAFLSSSAVARSQCLILDVSLPGMSGPQLQHELRLRGAQIPTIFITSEIDLGLRADLIAAGAVVCLFMPFGVKELCAALDKALGPSYRATQIFKNPI